MRRVGSILPAEPPDWRPRVPEVAPPMPDAYRAGLDFLFGRLNYERVGMPRLPGELRLGRMRKLLRLLGDPQDGLAIVHVAGTKGKGSTSAMIASASTASGVKTGLFCSPHLHRLEERFRIDGREPSEAEFATLIDAIRPAVGELDARAGRGPTFFEITAAMGLLHFARSGVGLVVLEVGLGGRLDSTNVVRPAVSVLTTISIDHTRQLGTTTAAIAAEKAGIIKRRTPVVSGVLGEAPRSVIRGVARSRLAPIREIDVDFEYRYRPPTPPLHRPTAGAVSVRTWRRDWGSIALPLLGEHQAHNAAVALAAIDALGELTSIDLDPRAVALGLSDLTWPARVEVVSDRPWLVIDGAHNLASAEALAETLRACFPPSERTLVFGTTREKDLSGQLRALIPLFDRLIATRYVENPRSVPPEEVASTLAEFGRAAEIAPDPASALELARRRTPPDGLICVTGSLFLAAEARALALGLNKS